MGNCSTTEAVAVHSDINHSMFVPRAFKQDRALIIVKKMSYKARDKESSKGTFAMKCHRIEG